MTCTLYIIYVRYLLRIFIGLAVNTRKTKYMKIGRHPGMMVNEHIRMCSNSYEKVKTFKYVDSSLTTQNSIHGEIRFRLKAGNSCYFIVQTAFPFSISFEEFEN